MPRWLYPLCAGSVVGALALLQSWFGTDGSLARHGLAGAFAVVGAGWVARRERSLQRLSHGDALTGLWNRRHFEQELDRELAAVHRTGESMALIVIDVDALKGINDRLGHHAGDAAIKIVGETLRATCRATDVCARWGGDEFVVLAPRTDAAQAQVLIERIRLALPAQCSRRNAEARLSGGATVPAVSVSAGHAIASTTDAGSLFGPSLFATADRAMYRKKSARRITGPLTDHLPIAAAAPRQ